MYTEINLEQGSPEWHTYRSVHIGASDAPIIMGVSPWKSARRLYEEKLGLKDSPRTPAMQRGIDLEDQARECIKKSNGLDVKPIVIESKQYPWMSASLDGISADGEIVEIKCAGSKDHVKALSGEVPKHYFPQLQHQIFVAGTQFSYYYSFDGFGGIMLRVERDDEYIDKMIKAEKLFYDCMMNFDIDLFVLDP